MKHLILLLAAVSLAACAGKHPDLAVKQFHLRDQIRDPEEEPMIRMEKARRLRGAVSFAERNQRLGQYYTLTWRDPAGAGQGPVKVVFEYRQGATGSLVKRMTKDFPASAPKGVVEFAVIGNDYFTGGKVLAWRAGVLRGGRELVSKQSYLWQ